MPVVPVGDRMGPVEGSQPDWSAAASETAGFGNNSLSQQLGVYREEMQAVVD